MALESDDAVVLQRLDYSETSQVLVLFTRRHGKLRVVAKGIKRSTKKRFAAAAELLDIGHVVYSARHIQHGSLGTLTEWKPGLPLGGLRSSLARLYLGQYAAEITARLTEDGDPDEPLFLALVQTLTEAAGSDGLAKILLWFQRVLLERIGSEPNLDACIGCGHELADGALHFSSLEGGLLCRDCEPAYVEKKQVSRETLAAMRGQPADARNEIKGAKLLNYHISHLMGAEPKVGRRLFQLLGDMGRTEANPAP